MTQAEVLDIVYETFQMAFQMAMPFLVVSMIVGVIDRKSVV